jgi:ectoine hydroxylase-related dioxygenase (phytanoyl-CoA dioxygenase family)
MDMQQVSTATTQPDLSPYHLTPEQIQFFDENGYLILRHWITGDLLERLQDAGQAWIDAGWQHPENPDFTFANREIGRVLFRVDYVHNKGQVASLELLGAPQVLGVAESLCGANFVPTYESMVFKQEGDGEAIPWHQDAVHPRKHRIFNYDLYLDRSVKGQGALRVIPKSQGAPRDICKLTDTYGWDHPDAITVEMNPGDVLLHDVMVVHGSERTTGNALRRTIYYEFRAAEEILEDGPWDAEWITRRLRLVPLGLNAHQEQYPDAPQFQWNVSDEFRPIPVGDAAQELKVAHIHHMQGAYCSAGNAGKVETVVELK